MSVLVLIFTTMAAKISFSNMWSGLTLTADAAIV